MKKIIAFAGSNSKKSINKQLAYYTAQQIRNAEVTLLDLNDFELPIFSVDYEAEFGAPEKAQRFLDFIHEADGVVLSLAEHNGAYSAALKNIFDWMSRIDGKLWKNTPLLLMATSPGARGGTSVLEIAKRRFPYMGADTIVDFSLPSFSQNFSESGISDSELKKSHQSAVAAFELALNA